MGMDSSPVEEQAGGVKKGGMVMAKTVSILFKVVLGLAFLVLGVWALKAWWADLLSLIRGGIGLFLVLIGMVTLAVAKE